jgi:hypothetical protein
MKTIYLHRYKEGEYSCRSWDEELVSDEVVEIINLIGVDTGIGSYRVGLATLEKWKQVNELCKCADYNLQFVVGEEDKSIFDEG